MEKLAVGIVGVLIFLLLFKYLAILAFLIAIVVTVSLFK